MQELQIMNHENFLSLIIPKFQRPLDMNIVNEIANHIKLFISQGRKPILGAIDVVEIKGTFSTTRYVIDGMHRLVSLKKIYEEGIRLDFFVIIYKCENEIEAKEIFNIKNKNVAVPIYIKENNDKTLYNDIQTFLSGIPGFNNKSMRPDINLSDFMNKLNKSKWMEDILTLDDFKNKIGKENERLKLLLNNSEFVRKSKISPNMKEKWNAWGLYIGVDNSFTWLM